jgi:hypothetical protein
MFVCGEGPTLDLQEQEELLGRSGGLQDTTVEVSAWTSRL